jgi:aminoglycoside phosphotransferase (APT) family kinase protein
MTHTEFEITAELVRDLLRGQHPDLAGYPVRLGARGWDNQLWRLGDELAVRLPWATQSADALLRKEYAWLPVLAPRLPLPVPVPQRLGGPFRAVSATLDRHHVGAGRAGRPRPRHACCGGGRRLCG